jgi:hypothetical protein
MRTEAAPVFAVFEERVVEGPGISAARVLKALL